MAEINNSVLSTNAKENRLLAVPKLIPDSIIYASLFTMKGSKQIQNKRKT